MPIAEREAQVVWEGTLAHGTGTLSSGSSALDGLDVTWASRTETPNGKTSPEELIAAAHASCFAMALSLVLGEAQATPERLVVHARCTFDEVEGAPTITRSRLELRARETTVRLPTSSSVIASSIACRHLAILKLLVQLTTNEESANNLPVP